MRFAFSYLQKKMFVSSLHSISYSVAIFIVFALYGCSKHTRMITDEVVLNDGNSQTGTILKSDSAKLHLKKIDESIAVIPWEKIDSVKGKKFKTFWVGFNYGYYSTPYFSVFKNEAMTGNTLSRQIKIGMAKRGNKLYYVNFFNAPADPYLIKKIGFGKQTYIRKTNYLSPKGIFIGNEINFMKVENNNGSQLTIDPFIGWERKWKEQIRFQLKLGLQLNLFNKNQNTGVNFSLGGTFLHKNFKKKYALLNTKHIFIR